MSIVKALNELSNEVSDDHGHVDSVNVNIKISAKYLKELITAQNYRVTSEKDFHNLLGSSKFIKELGGDILQVWENENEANDDSTIEAVLSLFASVIVNEDDDKEEDSDDQDFQ